MIKKILTIILTVLITTPLIGAFVHLDNTVKAEGYYPMSCNVYEVSYVNDDGSLSVVDNGCYNSFNEAKSRMKTNTDYVVRHSASLSPSKIIAMNSGFAYTYPARKGSLTMNLYANADQSGKTTYLTNHYEMTYVDTVEIISSNPGTGMIQIVMNGFSGYTDLEFTDLVPMKYIRNHLPIYLGGNDTTAENEQPFKVYPLQNKYYVDNGDLVFNYYRSYSKYGGDAESATLRIGAAPSFMTSGNTYYSNDGINFYTDRDLNNYVGTNYNYYQFLPLRSKSSITGSELDSYLNNLVSESAMKGHGQDFVNAQNNYGVNSLLLYAMALHESGNGTSTLAKSYNNLFGWGAYDSSVSSAKKYSSISECVAAQAGDNLSNYMDIGDWRYFGSFVGNRGSGFNVKYASDPYWGLKISAIAYRIDKSVGLRDYGNYTLALVNTYDAPLKQSANSGSKTYYTSSYGDGYQKNFITIALGQEGDFTKVQSTNPISNGNVVYPHILEAGTLAYYNFADSVGYYANNQITYLNGFKPVVIGDYIHGNESISLENGVLSISGNAYRENLKESGSNVYTTLTLIPESGSSKTVNLSSTLDGDVITYSGDIDVSNYDEGTYTLRINTVYSKYSYNDAYMISLDDVHLNEEYNDKLIATGYRNKYTVLTIKNIENDQYFVDRYINNMSFNAEDGLSIDGVAAIQGLNMNKDSRVLHQIVFVNLFSGDEIDFNASNTTSTYSQSDGLDYTYAGFEINIPTSKIPVGNYALKIRTVIDDTYKASRTLVTLDDNQCTSFVSGGLTYSLKYNDYYGYRVELSVESTPIDYSTINKGTVRGSMNCLNNLEFDNDGNMIIEAGAMIYYHNYDNNNIPTYKIYLIDDKDNYEVINADVVDSPIDFKTILESRYNLDNVYFKAVANLNDLDLDEGEYNILVEITFSENGTNYKDYIELTNTGEYIIMPSTKVGNKDYTFKLSNVRDRIYLEVE